MPTYEYQCDACQHNFDEFQSITSEPLKKCPKCGKKKLRRLIGTGTGIIFRGSGFYITDYRSESYKAAAKAEQDAAKPPESKDSGGKKETKTSSESSHKPPAKKTHKPKT